MLPHNFQLFCQFFLEKKSFKDVLLIFLCNPPPLVLWINDLNKRKSTLPKYVSIQVPAFLAEWFLIERFLKFFLCIFQTHVTCKTLDTPKLGPNHTSKVMLFTNLNLHYQKVTACQTNCVLRGNISFLFYIIL